MILEFFSWLGIGALFLLGLVSIPLPIFPGIAIILAALWLARRMIKRKREREEAQKI